jgi:hypothetical protein
MTLMRMNDDHIKRAYFDWLCDLVKGGKPGHDHKAFLWSLYQTEFFSIIPIDRNREEDGKKLREQFPVSDLPQWYPYLNGECTVLEMLIALSQRIEYILADPQEEDRTDIWFWGLIDNLALEIFNEKDPHIEIKLDRNDRKIQILLERRYLSSGKGGLFPLRRPKRDQREVEIWYQMQNYLEENNPND